MNQDRQEATPGRGLHSDAFLWLLVAIAFSPVLFDLFAHLSQRHWAIYPLVFPLLMLREAPRTPRQPAQPIPAYLFLATGMILELVMVRAGWPRMARPGLVLAILGLCLLQGRPALRTALLALWCVPIPHAVVSLASPILEAIMAAPAAILLSLMGLEGRVQETEEGLQLWTSQASLPIADADGGIPLAVLLAGLGWWSGIASGIPLRAGLARSVMFALLAFPVQTVCIILAGLTTVYIGTTPVRHALDWLPWLLCTTVAVLLVERRRTTPPVPPDPPLYSPSA